MGKRLDHSMLLAAGFALAAAGLAFLYQALGSAEDGADAAATRMFQHYTAAAAAVDRLHWRRELLAALTAGRQALIANPARADVSLQLAATEFWLFGPGDAVYASLRLSFLTAPHELWIIERRIGLDLSLAADAPPDVLNLISRDIRVLGEPFRDTNNYRVLARAASLAGPRAVTLVRHQLERGHPWPFQLFNQYLGELPAPAAAPPR